MKERDTLTLGQSSRNLDTSVGPHCTNLFQALHYISVIASSFFFSHCLGIAPAVFDEFVTAVLREKLMVPGFYPFEALEACNLGPKSVLRS
jgi:hypothetical protein